MSEDLINRIYECSVVPELWPGVLDELAALSGSEGGILFSARDRILNWTASMGLKEVFSDYVSNGWFRQCSRRVCLFSSTQPAFLVEHDFWTEDQLAANPIYRDFFRPRGLGWSAGTGLPMQTGDNIVFSIERKFHDGPLKRDAIEQLNMLRPHLARSAFISARLGMQRAAGASEILTALGLPTFLLGGNGEVISANDLVETLPEHFKWHSGTKISFADVQANDQLKAALDSSSETSTTVLSFPVRDKTDAAVLVAHLIPISRSAQDLFSLSYMLLVLTPVKSTKAPSADLIRSLFDLTISEARVARGLSCGHTLEDIAASGGVALSTVRSQLKQILAKTGCGRQAELVSLLANVAIQN